MQPTQSSDVTVREDPSATSHVTSPSDAAPDTDATLVEAADATTPDPVPLVAGFQLDGWRLREAIKVASGEADLWVAVGKDSQTAVVKVFHWGLRIKAELAEKLTRVSRAQVVDVYGRGLLSDGRHYEILEHIQHGTLADLGKRGMVPAQVKEVLKELAQAVEALHEAGILHRDLKPSNVLVRTVEPLDLVLTDFGISSLADFSLHATSAHRTAAYSAPEAMTGVVSRASDWWSVGVMVLELLRAAHPFAGLDERAINFQLVTRGIAVPADLPPEWGMLIKGLLTRDHARRWGAEQVGAWLEGKRNMPVYYAAAAAAVIGQRPYRFQGGEYGDAATLAVALAEKWEEGVKHWGRGYVLQWVEKDLSDQDLANQLNDVREDKTLATAELQLAAVALAMNAELPLSYKGELVSAEWLGVNWGSGKEVLESGLSKWLKQMRRDDSLETAAQRWQMGSSYLKSTEVPCEIDTAGRLLASGNQALVDDLVGERRSKYVKGRQDLLTQLLKKESLEFNEAVLLASASDKAFYTAPQLLIEETTDWLDKQCIKYDERKAIPLILATDQAEVIARADRHRQGFTRGRTPAAEALLRKENLEHRDAVLLLTASGKAFATPEQVLVEDGLAWLDSQYVTYDKHWAASLLSANTWDMLMPLVEQRKAAAKNPQSRILADLLVKPELKYWEGVLLATASLTLFFEKQEQPPVPVLPQPAPPPPEPKKSLGEQAVDAIVWLVMIIVMNLIIFGLKSCF